MDTNLPKQIAEILEAEIISGHLKPGTILQQEALAERFEVSRQPVRAALDILSAKTLTRRKSNRTVEVCGLEDNAAGDILEIRRVLEPMALAASIDLLTEQDLLLARQAQERFRYETQTDRIARHDADLHLGLYSRCPNKVLLQLIADLRKTNQRAYLGQPLGSASRDKCIAAHESLLEAVAKKDLPAATKLLIDHFDISKERTL